MSIAINIVDIAVETATKNQAKKINSVVLELGKLSGVVRGYSGILLRIGM